VALVAALLCAPAASGRTAGKDPEALRKAAQIHRERGEFEEAREALRAAIELAPNDTSLYEELADVFQAEGRGSEGKDPRILEVVEEVSTEEAAKLVGDLLNFEIRDAEGLIAGWKPRDLGILGGLALLLLIILRLLAREMRGKGDLVVSIELPQRQRGTFSVRLSTKPEAKRRVAEARRRRVIDDESRASTRFEHYMVARETQFHTIPARHYFVVVEGAIEDPARHGSRTPVFEEREVRVTKGRTMRLELDLRPKQCPVEVRVLRGGKPAPQARVALGGDPTSLRYARGGRMELSLPIGSHSILAGCEDRAAERQLEIESFEPQVLVIEMDADRDLVFSNSPRAVEPFLQGDLSVAAAALERDGQLEMGHLLSARFHRERGEKGVAAGHYEAAGRLLQAGELRVENGEPEQAAALFERAGDSERAAEIYSDVGDLLRAGRAYEEAGELESAIVCYRDAGAIPKLIDVLEKAGQYFEAATLCHERNEISRAIRAYQQVDSRHPEYFQACRILAETFSEQGKLELAVQKADEAISFSRPGAVSSDSYAWYGDLLDKAGRPDRALAVFQELREQHPEHPHIATRIEEIKKRLSKKNPDGDVTAPDGIVLGSGASRYELLEEIGRGGMGVVYRARDKRLERDVALKRLPENLKDHPKVVELFLREARASAALNHPNIVTIHDVDQEDGVFFITMELLEGIPINKIVDSRGRLSSFDTARLGVQITAGLGYAHDQRIIHRDIKSANLFFTNEKVVKIMDFGLAKMLEEVRKATTVVGGTPFYMAPEQSMGSSVDHRADLYALGVTLFEMVTGKVPFTDGDIPFHHRHTAAPDPREREPGVSEAMAVLILELLVKNPDERIQTAAEVARRLQKIADALKR
jgi:tetratricopeptide (TPR) repeat protein